MASSLFTKLFQKHLRRFFVTQGREPITPKEWMDIRDLATREINQTKGVPKKDVIPSKKGAVVDLFATEKEFADDLYSMGQNFIRNDPMFNLEFATKLRNPGAKTYGWTPSGDKSKLLSPRQRQTTLDRLKKVMHDEEYQHQFAEDFLLEDGSLFKLTDDMFTIEKAEGGRIGMAGGGSLFKFIERLFIKASNDIRLGRGKFKGLDQKQKIVQHDNLTKKVTEFQKTGKLPEGTEQYFDVNPHEAFKQAEKKALLKKYQDETGLKTSYGDKDSIPGDEGIMDAVARGNAQRAEKEALQAKYPGVTDDLLEKILIDDNPQRKAEVLATMDEYLKLREVGKGEEEAFNIVVDSFQKPTKHAEGGRAEFIFGGSAGLKSMWKHVLKNLSKGRDKPVTKLFPKLSAEDRAMEKMVMGHPEQKAFRAREQDLRLEGIDILINRLKHDKKILRATSKKQSHEGSRFGFFNKTYGGEYARSLWSSP